MSDSIKQSELLHFTRGTAREDVQHYDRDRRAEIVESALAHLYRFHQREHREELVSLIISVMSADQSVADLFTDTAYTVCDHHLVIRYVNPVFLERSHVELDELLGKSLYYEREYEGTEIEQLYSMVMETRLVADALVRYVTPTEWSGKEHDGWFAIVVIPLDSGGIGVLSRFAHSKEELAEEVDPTSPEAPRFITIESQKSSD